MFGKKKPFNNRKAGGQPFPPLPSTAWRPSPPPVDLSQRIPDPQSLAPRVPVFTRRNTNTGFLNFSAAGTLDCFVPGCSCSALWIEFQVGQTGIIQLLKNGEPISKQDSLNSGTFRRYAGLLLAGNEKISLYSSVAQTVAFEVAWAVDFHLELLLVDDAVSSQGSTGGGPSSNVNIVSPVDGSGNVKVAVENTPAVTVSGTVPVSGSVSITGTPTVVATQTTGANLHVDVDNFPATQPVSGTVAVSGNVTVVQPTGSNLHADIDNFPATQPVSGTVAVSNFPAIQPISGTVVAEIEGHAGATLDSAAGTPNSQAVTVQGNASGVALPISGSVSLTGSPTVIPDAIYNATAPTVTSGSNEQTQCDSTGAIFVDTEGRKATYRASINGFAALVGAFFTLQGSATKTVKITRVRFSMSVVTGATTPAKITYQIVTSLTGGTAVATGFGTILDSNDPSPTAITKNWSAAPTISATNAIDAFDYQLTTVSASTAPAPPLVDSPYGGNGARCPTLRGASQWFTISASAIGTTPSANVVIEWTEE